MKNYLTIIFLLFPASGMAEWEPVAEVGLGVFYNRNDNLVMVGGREDAGEFLGQPTYQQVDLGHWQGPNSATFIGYAKGFRFGSQSSQFRVSTGASLISDTGDRLSTGFQFYEQFMLYKELGNVELSISYRHWSNAGIKLPNWGMDFASARIIINW